MLNVKKAIILAGGMGTRLRPVTLEIPKPLLTVKRRPILNYILEMFARHDVSQPIILINKDHQEDYRWWQKRHQDELPKELKIEVEPEPLGTFGGLKNLRHQLSESFILSNGDELKDFDLSAIINFHKNHPDKPLATIVLVKVPNPTDYGVPVLEGSKISDFIEKPSISGHRKSYRLAMSKALDLNGSAYISSGLYILEPEVFDYADWSKKFLMIEKDIFPKLAAAGKLVGYKVKNGRWFDCGTFKRWERAIKEW